MMNPQVVHKVMRALTFPNTWALKVDAFKTAMTAFARARLTSAQAVRDDVTTHVVRPESEPEWLRLECACSFSMCQEETLWQGFVQAAQAWQILTSVPQQGIVCLPVHMS
jgi:hypothetical protein